MRTDPHRLQVLDPTEYVSCGFEDMHEDEGMIEVDLEGFQDLKRHYREYVYRDGARYVAASASYTDSEAYSYLMSFLEEGISYGCRICGQAHGNRYWYYFQHQPTGDVIRVGSQCAIMVGLGSREELEDRRAYERRDMALVRGHHLARQPKSYRQALGVAMDAVMDWQEANEVQPFTSTGARMVAGKEGLETPWIYRFAADVLSKFNTEGYLSDKQWRILTEFSERVRKDRERIERKVTREEQWQREEEEAEPVPTEDRITLVGEVIKTDYEPDPYSYDGQGDKKIMIVKDERGFKVKGTVPSAIYNVEKGDKITFAARCKQSRKNTKFGFYSRPTKAKIIEKVEE